MSLRQLHTRRERATLTQVGWNRQTIQFDKRDNTDKVFWMIVEEVDTYHFGVRHMIVLVSERNMCDLRAIGIV